jgi:hypothetical protein
MLLGLVQFIENDQPALAWRKRLQIIEIPLE